MLFKNNIFSLFFLVIPLIIYRKRKKKNPYLRFSSGRFFTGLYSVKIVLTKYLFLLRISALILLIFAVMRPQAPLENTKITTDGVDIVLAIDCSTSMLAEDFTLGGARKNRLEVVKNVVGDFIKKRKNDRIGVIAFAARAYTVCPLTLDYNWLAQSIVRVEIGMIEDSTAVGSSIAASLDRLKDSQAKSKIVILLTDGVNNAGSISPLTGAETAKALGVKVYTIGAGSHDYVPYPAYDFFGSKVYQKIKIDLDEESLRKIAAVTGGQYFSAQDTDSLRKIYGEIDKLEKTLFKEHGYLEYKELFYLLAAAALILLVLEVILANTVFLKLP